VAGDRSETRAVTRLLTVCVGLLLMAVAYRYRRSGSVDPVSAVRLVAVRVPTLRADLRIDDLGPACDDGALDACVDLGLNYAELRNDGSPLPPCLDHALFALACDGGDWRGCREVARTSHRGDCGEADLAHAKDVLDAACARLEFAACDAKAEL
jgi:hypothetical protein